MVRIVPGASWKLNPDYLSTLRAATERPRRFSADAVLDVLGIEIDGVNVTAGLSEAAIFPVVDALAALVLRLCRSPSAAGQVSLADGATELVLGRRGAKASLALVSLGRPARLLAGELVVDLSALAEATAGCARALLADLADVNDALSASPFARRLARRAELLRKAARLTSGARSRRPAPAPLAPLPLPAPVPDAPTMGFTLLDDEGRIETFRSGGELYSLLGPGEVFLRDARGEVLARAKGPPFLTLTDLSRAAAELVEAARAAAPTWEGRLAPGAAKLSLDLAGGHLAVGGRSTPCRALPLARTFLQGVLDFGGAVVGRSAGQSKNPYLCALLEGARERLEHLRHIEAGDVFAEGAEAPRARRADTGEPLGTGKLRRLRFRVAWKGVDTGGRALSATLVDGALLVLGPRHATFLDAATGAVRARRQGDGAVLAESGVLLSQGGRLWGLSADGAPRFLRDPGGPEEPLLLASLGSLRPGPHHPPATLCLLEGGALTAIDSATGRGVWRFHAPQANRLSAAALGARVYAAADNGFLYALDAATGAPVFRVRSDYAFEGALAVAGGVVASLGRQDGALSIAAVDAATGRPRLARPLPVREAGTPLPWRRRLAVGAVADGESQVVALSLAGKEIFRASLGPACGVPALLPWGGRLFASLRDGTMACIDREGVVAWRSQRVGIELDHALPPVVRRNVLVAPGDPMRALDPRTGATLCELPPTQGLSALAVGDGLDVHTVDDDGVAACFQLATHLSLVG